MALLFMDGFDAGDYDQKWDIVDVYNYVNSSATTRFNTGKSLIIESDNNVSVTHNFSPATTVYIGFAMRIGGTLSGGYFLSLRGDDGLTTHLQLRLISINSLGLYRNTTQVAVFAVPSLTDWHYYEMSATIDDAAGTCEVRVDGITCLNFTGDTRNGGTAVTFDKLLLNSSSTITEFYFDDLYICDGTGTTNNTFLGDVRVITTVPTAAGSATDLTPTGGDNYANVADIPDNTATYNSSVTAGHKDLYTMGDVPASVTAVHAVQANSHAWKTDAGTKSLKNAIKSGTTTAYGATVSLPTSVAHQGDIFEVDPDTSAAWTVSGVNGVEAGAEVV